MYELLIKGFKTKEQAIEFFNWYEGQGEQDITVWLECRESESTIDITTLHVDLGSFGNGKWIGNQLQMVVKPA